MNIKKIIALISCAAIVAIAFVGCSRNAETTSYIRPLYNVSGQSSEKVNNDSSDTESKEEYIYYTEPGENGSRTDDELGFQFDLPQSGEEIAVLNTSKGVIKIRLFEESAPLAVANFKAQISNGYYNGLTFHRVINDFMIQGGDDGKGSKSVWGKAYQSEVNRNLQHFTGAVSTANAGPDTNGSQFFIVQGPQVTMDDLDAAASTYNTAGMTETEKQLYIEHGGAYWLDNHVNSTVVHTVFGQVFEGMDVVNSIASVLTNRSDKPLDDIVIESAAIEIYQ